MAAPRISNQAPRQHEGSVLPSTQVVLHVVDDDGNLVDSSVILTVNGVVAWSSDAQQNSFLVTKLSVLNGNRYEITPPANFDLGAVEMRVQADDGTNNLDETYHFFVNSAPLLDDHFGGVGVAVQPGNGTITASGGKLVIDALAGVNMDWFTFGRSGAIGLVPLLSHVKDYHSVVYVETTLASWVTTNTSDSHSVWGLYLDDQNFYWIYTHDGTNWNAYKTVGNSWVFQGAYAGNPVASPPTRLRFKWDRSADTIAWQIYDGGWQDIVAPQALAVAFTDVLFGHKTYSSLPAATSEYENLLIFAEGELTFPRDEEVAHVTDAVSLTAESDPARAGQDYLVGPKHYSVGASVGVEIPGPPQQQVGSIGPFDVAGPEEQALFPEIPGAKTHAPGISQGLNLGGLADTVLGQALVANVVDDAPDVLLGLTPTFSDLTTDSDFNAHFTEKRVKGAFFYNTTGEDWANPVSSSLTGFARDGNRYTAGVQDGGPVQAPWASEAFSVTRGNRDDFPEQALVVWTEDTITIFDVTNYPTNLSMWMRFIGHSSFHMIGNTAQVIEDVKMINGVLCVATSVAPPGRLHIIDFKGDSAANIGHLIGGDDHWRWNGTIAGRNAANSWITTGLAVELRINSEDNYNLAVYKDGAGYWVAVSGEDRTHLLNVDDSLGSVPQTSVEPAQANIAANIGDIRNATFDEFGWFWLAEQTKLVRNASRWQGNMLLIEDHANAIQRGGSDFHPQVLLPYNITQVVAARDFIYCGTENGIYRVNRGTLEIQLAYTIVGGGGGGRLNAPPAGEVILGDQPQILWLHSYNLDGSSYLSVATYRGVVTIRLFDDFVTQGLVYPALFEHRAYFNTSIVS